MSEQLTSADRAQVVENVLSDVPIGGHTRRSLIKKAAIGEFYRYTGMGDEFVKLANPTPK